MSGYLGVDMTGQRYGRLVVEDRAPSVSRLAYWAVRCDCGAVSTVRGSYLRRGKTRSCGCLVRAPRPSVAEKKIKHGMSGTPEYTAYMSARSRCRNPRDIGFKYYGDRGIEFRFTSFKQWLDELGLRPSPDHSVDRIDVDGHYELGNVRWATRAEQEANKRCHCRHCPEHAS